MQAIYSDGAIADAAIRRINGRQRTHSERRHGKRYRAKYIGDTIAIGIGCKGSVGACAQAGERYGAICANGMYYGWLRNTIYGVVECIRLTGVKAIKGDGAIAYTAENGVHRSEGTHGERRVGEG